MLQLNAVTKHYPHFDLNISLNVPTGQIIGLVGRNGAGKSTTFELILGLTQPDHGQITIFGKPVAQLPPAQRSLIGTTFPDSFFAETFTINDLTRILKATYTTFSASTFQTACTHYQLPLAKPLRTFSTGMLAKLKLLVALHHNAKLLILDEPTAGLDVVVRQQLLGLLQDYLDSDPQRSILISSHIASDLEQLCDQLIFIEQGQVVLQEETDVLLNAYGVLQVAAADFANLDQAHLLVTQPTDFGYLCLTNERQYYHETYPQLVIEPGSLDQILLLLTKEGVTA
ncbi:ATP-binding cassette domain-containing protein [Loigolactobacillus bifermentans]|uniref:ABC-2 type transport system ATP-binding protein n=1 Tax=Loigolactobacillus bifermentans DSM 20003 TaxID=1423726 RepID=A0A0R1GZP4_9LACO|nr:ABC transporter ATP-binding protein [Loigolactobacillus bifermentans]KRK39480.1 ABC-2 type transport system ATP-binding protein [Loigolactobacillus bifermentans DSM 20003]QGG61247.1 ATP-binding cassette domain-containing protein [Loigolactobacillus bifermentans]